MIPNTLKNLNLHVDGRGYAGRVEELNPPKLTVKTEEFRGGGMDAPVALDMGMEKLMGDFTLPSLEANLLRQWGKVDVDAVGLTFRGAFQGQNGVQAQVIQVRGRIVEVDEGTWKGGEKQSTKYSFEAVYYRRSIDGVVIHEIDVINMIRVIDGVDQLAAQRAALGL